MADGTHGTAAGAAPTPTFAITFDTELIWGSFDQLTPEAFARRFPDVRGTIVSILRLLDAYAVPATWAVVGHLYLSSCARDAAGLPHPELVHPRQCWRPGDWLSADPCTDRDRDPLWYGEDVLDAIQLARTPHEIGCHSFSHALFDDPEMTLDAVNADLDACVALAARRGLVLRSFVFPRNREGHHQALLDHGFRAFRGADPTWYVGRGPALRRAAHLVDQAVGLAPPCPRPHEGLPGLWDIPGSALMIGHYGPRRMVTRVARVRKARAGLRAAQATGGVFHLWTHPFNLATDRPFMLGVLDAILREAAEARERGDIVIETMGAIAERMSRMTHPGRPADR